MRASWSLLEHTPEHEEHPVARGEELAAGDRHRHHHRSDRHSLGDADRSST